MPVSRYSLELCALNGGDRDYASGASTVAVVRKRRDRWDVLMASSYLELANIHILDMRNVGIETGEGLPDNEYDSSHSVTSRKKSRFGLNCDLFGLLSKA